jgi:hypothetical protein
MPGEHAVTSATEAPGPRSELVAATLALLAVVVMCVLAFIDPALTGRLVAEDGLIEWIQAGLCGAASLAMAVRAGARLATGRSAVVEILAAAMFAGLLIGEVDLDKRVFGVKIIATRFFVDDRFALPGRALAVLVVVGVPVALALYAIVRRAELWREGLRLLQTPRGRVLAAGVVIFGSTEVFEGLLGAVPGVPRYFLEELLEMVAGISFLVGATARH